MTCRPFGPHALMGADYRPAGCTCGTLLDPYAPPNEKGQNPMTNIAAPEHIDATRAGAAAIEKAFRIREIQGRLLEVAAKIGPVAEKASLLRLEIDQITAELAKIESEHMATVTEAKGDDGKKLHSNKEAREAACAKAMAEDANAQAMQASLTEKRTERAKAEADLTALTTEVGALKAAAMVGSAALNALGLAVA